MKYEKYLSLSEDYNKLLSGEIIPYFVPVNYSSPKNKRKLELTIREQEEILTRKEVNWAKLNEFRIIV
jgi:hypothetical protein